MRVVYDEGAIGDLSARNRLHGFVEDVRIDGLLAQVRLRVGDQRLTAVITADAVRVLKLRRGDDAMAIIKSTEVMIAKGMRPEGRGVAASPPVSAGGGPGAISSPRRAASSARTRR